jgi:hypothetical protein
LPFEEIDSLPEEKREKLFLMHDETARLFSGNYNAADMGLSELPEDAAEGAALDAESAAEVSAATTGIPIISVKGKPQ